MYKLDTPVTVNGVHQFGKHRSAGVDDADAARRDALDPDGAGQKHWIQALLGEDPFIPYPYYYDVVPGRTRSSAASPAPAS